MWKFKKDIYRTAADDTPLPTFLSMAYSGTNCIIGSNSNFTTARSAGSSTMATTYRLGCSLVSGGYDIARVFAGFNTVGVTSATSGGIQLTLNEGAGVLDFNMNVVVIRTNTTWAVGHNWVLSDYTEGVAGTQVSSPVTIPAGTPLDGLVVNIPFNATGITYLNSIAPDGANYVIMQYTNDRQNVAPVADNREEVTGNNSNIKLYYS